MCMTSKLITSVFLDTRFGFLSVFDFPAFLVQARVLAMLEPPEKALLAHCCYLLPQLCDGSSDSTANMMIQAGPDCPP